MHLTYLVCWTLKHLIVIAQRKITNLAGKAAVYRSGILVYWQVLAYLLQPRASNVVNFIHGAQK